jgi:hypothetical protein
MKTLYISSVIVADPERKQAAEDMVAKIVAHAEKMKWTVLKKWDRPLNLSGWGICSPSCWSNGKNGVRKKIRFMDIGALMKRWDVGENDLFMESLSLTYCAETGQEGMTVSFRVNTAKN